MFVTTVIQVGGMTCSSCSNSISAEVKKIDGVDSVSVSLLTEEATVKHAPSVTTEELVEKIEDLGFDANFMSSAGNPTSASSATPSYANAIKTIVQVGGMTCSSCSNTITNSLLQIPGVSSVNVSLLTEEATIVHDSYIDPSTLCGAIEDLGFDANLISSVSEKEPIPVMKYKTELTISGMTCTSCVKSITNELEKLDGIDNVSVSLMTEKAVVIHEESLPVDLIKEHIEDLGFDATIISVCEISSSSNDNMNANSDIVSGTLKLYGLVDQSSADAVEQNISNLNGIVSCQVSFASEEITVEYDPDVTGIRAILEVINASGFDALVKNKLDSTTQIDLLAKVKEINYWRGNFFSLLKFGLPVIFLSHIFPIIRKSCHWDSNKLRITNGLYWDIILQFILGTYIQFWLGKKFYINCFKSLSHGSGSMDVLICTSTSIIYFYSIFSIIHGIFIDGYPVILFDTSTMLLLFVSLGKWVESKAKGNTSTALSKLLSLAPSSCIIVRNPEVFNKGKVTTLDSSQITQQQIGIDLLQKNDIAIILPGAKVPSDGVCVFSTSEVDESLLTGESLPVKKVVGSLLIGGSVNLTSTIFMRITKLGEQTQLQQIVKLVKNAQISNAPVQRFSDTIASIFVPCILIFSILSLIFWTSYVKCTSIDSIPPIFLDSKDPSKVAYFKVLQIAISVIVVACPCALGLAAPTAVMVGTGVGATNGILIKGGEVLENASKVNCVIFDKTGTLTNGLMELTNFRFLGHYTENANFLWSLLQAIESNSEHPIGKAIVRCCTQKLLNQSPSSFEISSVDTHAGLGITANCVDLETKRPIDVKLGNSKFLEKFKIVNMTEFEETLTHCSVNFKINSICHILINGFYAGYVELSDSLKSDAKTTIETFIDQGYSVGMVTGDLVDTSRHVANLLSIPLNNVLAEASPEQKLEYVKKLQEMNFNVAFVGDGINDAPALVQSNVGVAISSGTDIAMSAADIILLSSTEESSIAEGVQEENDSNNSHIGLLGVYASFDISSATFSTIKLNFLLAIIYNMVMLPIAMGLLIIPFSITMHPMFASAAMACSSISVVGNSLRLKRWSVTKLKRKMQNSADKPYNLGWNDGLADTRANINELSVDSFIANSNGRLTSVNFAVSRFYRSLTGLFRRQNQYTHLN
ncbi:hypothetical protein PMKS-003712 [Pichia membranifaciens]|uniref:P-type Cu(+) transporter n=1 Tax=Pichia membranifaciens TaxID=4926 RepID=A0A1Q2YLG9_9ASCO|nr:hypothetical protein PMKS-003712 [Pichia membranifaciens]